jgi:hypothetical protein
MTSSEPTSSPDEQAPWKRRAAAAEINGRRVNEAIERGTDGPRPVFVCECGNLGCQAKVTLSIPSYESVRQDFDRFFVVPGHEIAGVDQVVEEHPGFLIVVKKEPEAKAMAEQSDERSE